MGGEDIRPTTYSLSPPRSLTFRLPWLLLCSRRTNKMNAKPTSCGRIFTPWCDKSLKVPAEFFCNTVHCCIVNIYFMPSKLSGSTKQDFWPKINSNQMKLPHFVNPSADRSPKIRHDFSNKEVQKWKLSKKKVSKKMCP